MTTPETGDTIDRNGTPDRTVKIEIFGQAFRFKSDDATADPEKIARRFEEYIQRAEQEIQFTASGKNKVIILLLAGMNISRDLFSVEEETLRLKDGVARRTTSLLNKFKTLDLIEDGDS